MSSMTESLGDRRCCWLSIGSHGFAIKVELGIKFTWSPTSQHFLQCFDVNVERLRECRKIRGHGYHRPNVEVLTRPAVPSLANTCFAAYSGMADSTGETNRF